MEKFIELHSILENPYYMFGAFKSQASNLAKYQSTENLKLACYAASVSKYIKRQDARCFCSLDCLLSTYNSIASQFGLKSIGKSTFCTIQKAALSSGLVKKETIEHSTNTGRNYRLLSINPSKLLDLFPSIFALAARRASQRKNRKLESNGDSVDNHIKARPEKASSELDHTKNWTITTKRSKDQNNKNKAPASLDFYKARFGHNADNAKSLQDAARNGKISAAGALKLMNLHSKHNVSLAESFRKYLLWVVCAGKELAGKLNRPSHSQNNAFAEKTQHLIESGLGIHCFDRHGALYVRFVDGSESLTQTCEVSAYEV
ncbi:TPA: hypothetical protein ACVU5P_004238 [Vibrio parahaemolyticus]